ncbi:hypothetical protein ACJX0J_022215 [Zea mays]
MCLFILMLASTIKIFINKVLLKRRRRRIGIIKGDTKQHMWLPLSLTQDPHKLFLSRANIFILVIMQKEEKHKSNLMLRLFQSSLQSPLFTLVIYYIQAYDCIILLAGFYLVFLSIGQSRRTFTTHFKFELWSKIQLA